MKEWCGPVTYKVELEDGSGKGLVCHLNTLKRYMEQFHTVGRTAVVVDYSNDELEEASEQKKIVGEGSCIGFCRKQLDVVLGDFKGSMSKQPGLTNLTVMGIDTGDAKPISQHPYRPSVQLIPQIREELNSLLEQGLIVESTSSWSSPMIPVKKPDGRIRVCVDFRRINAVTHPLPCYMPMLEELVDCIGQSTVISKLNLSKRFH